MTKTNTIAILGDLDHVVTASINKDKYSAYEYTSAILPISRNASGATTINCLYAINNELEKILEGIEGSKNETYYMAVPSKLFKTIQKGTYKNWIINKGKASTGYSYTDKEMKEWGKFASLYSKLFLNVNFRDIAYYYINDPKYNAKEMAYIKNVILKMKQFMKRKKDKEMEEFMANL